MELTIEVAPESEAVESGLSSPMGGKHQRSLSLSEKWATNKALALEYLKRQREIMVWVESVLKRKLPANDLHESLKSGIVLRELMEVLFPQAASSAISPISRKYSLRMAPWKERENISVFLKQCKALGMNDFSLFCTDDLYEGTNMVQVLFCVQHFMKFSAEHSGHDFQPVTKHSASMNFSNQELEMAMSKLEQAGMNASALKDLIGSSELASDASGDEEVRGAEIVDGFGADTESPNASGDGDAGEDEDAEISKQLDQLEQDLITGECNQMCDTAGDAVDTEATKGTKADFPEVEDVDDDADPALHGPQDAVCSELFVNEVLDAEQVVDEEEEEADVEAKAGLSAEDLQELNQVLSAMIADIEAATIKEVELLQEEQQQQDEGEEAKTELPVEDSDVGLMVPHQMCRSELNTELTDGAKSETAEAGSSAHAVAEEVTEVETQTKVPKRKKKRSKTKRARSSSDEQLEAEVMAKCACGRGCTMM